MWRRGRRTNSSHPLQCVVATVAHRSSTDLPSASTASRSSFDDQVRGATVLGDEQSTVDCSGCSGRSHQLSHSRSSRAGCCWDSSIYKRNARGIASELRERALLHVQISTTHSLQSCS